MTLIIKLESKKRIPKNELLSLIKKEAAEIDINKIMQATTFLREDAKYMQSPYREDYIERFSKAFFVRIVNIKDDTADYKGCVDIKKLREFLESLNNLQFEAKSQEEECFLKIAGIIATYTTFVREESIHPVGTKFPGGLQLKNINGKYLCPVKEKQMNNPSALCRFCVSVQDKSI
jgi:uncharacterized protein (UPF0305 family)